MLLILFSIHQVVCTSKDIEFSNGFALFVSEYNGREHLDLLKKGPYFFWRGLRGRFILKAGV